MMKNEIEKSDITYVLFGKEAIGLYKMSIRMLINSIEVDYKVGAYVSIKKFVDETKAWDDFLEISKQDFLLLRKVSQKTESPKKVKKASYFLNLFR